VLLVAATGCSLVAPLDGLAGGESGLGRDAALVEGGGGGDAGGSGFDAATADSGAPGDASAVDGGALDAPFAEEDAPAAPLEAEVSDAASPDAPHDAEEEPPPVAPIQFVQVAASGPAGMVASVSAKLLQAQAAGDLDVVAIGWNDTTGAISSVSDTSGNAYVLAVGPTRLGSDLTQAIYYAKDVEPAAAGANSVTVAFVQTANVVDLRVAEYSGLDPAAPLDETAVGSASSAGPATTAAVTTKTGRELLFVAGMSTDLYSGPGTGFSERLVTLDGDLVEDRVVAATGSYAGSAPLGQSCEWILQMATFR
jgi:hypothetical protein